MTAAIQIAPATSREDIAAVRGLFKEYLGFVESYLGQSLSFQGTDAEFADFPQTYDALLLAKMNGEAVAACGVKPFKGTVCELKRLYCAPAARGHGFGLALCEMAVKTAFELGYSDMYLDTDHGLTHANTIYERLGFRDIGKYYDNPMDSRFMALCLDDFMRQPRP